MYEKKDAERRKILVEVSKFVAMQAVANPLDETEEHLNHVLLDLAKMIKEDDLG